MSQNFVGQVHPSVFIYEELQERVWTVRDLVFRMRRYEGEKDWAINQLAVEMYLDVHDRRIFLSDEMAKEFGLAFGTSWELWRNLHDNWLRGTPESESK